MRSRVVFALARVGSWFSGRATELVPESPALAASRLVELAGSREKLLAKARYAFQFVVYSFVEIVNPQ